MSLVVPARFCGPRSSGNGGWTAGALAGRVALDRPDAVPDDRNRAWPPIRVDLLRPPPLDTPLEVATDDGATVARDGADVVARARLLDDDPVAVPDVPADEARTAESSYVGHTAHPFPTCFACGTAREPGDGLRIFPGRVADTDDGRVRLAATWVPDPSTSEDWHAYVDDVRHASLATTWAALDCVGGWAGDLTERLMVLASMTARVDALPVIGDEHVVVGSARGREGRKTWTSATLYDADRRVVAVAEHLWVQVDPDLFNDPG